MEPTADNTEPIASSFRRLARRLLTIGENRIELLLVEVQEERARLLHTCLLGLGATALGLLAALTLTAAIVVWLWAYSPLLVLLVLTGLYGGAAGWLGRRLAGRLREGQPFSTSLEQLRKDRACMEKTLE